MNMKKVELEVGDKVQYGRCNIAYVAKVLKDNQANLIGPCRVWSKQKISQSKLRLVQKAKKEGIKENDLILLKNYLRPLKNDGSLLSRRQIVKVDKVFNEMINVSSEGFATVVNKADAILIKGVATVYSKAAHNYITKQLYENFGHEDIVKVGLTKPVYFRVTEENGMKSISEIRLYEPNNK